jgi:hypothetical protein
MSRTAILHIGTHKTGTTSFQTMIACNSAHFAAQGLYYPTAGRDGPGHHNLAWELSRDDRYNPAAGSIADLVEELRNLRPNAVLVSSEDFEYLYSRPERLDVLQCALDALEYSTRVILMVRDPCEYLESLYSALVRHGLTTRFDTFVADALKNRGVLFGKWDFRLDYSQLVEGFATTFGRDAIRVLAYDRADSASRLFEACSHLTGASFSPIPGWERLNVRDQPEQTEELVRKQRRAALRRKWKNPFSLVGQRGGISRGQSSSGFVLSPAQRASMASTFGCVLVDRSESTVGKNPAR